MEGELLFYFNEKKTTIKNYAFISYIFTFKTDN